MAKTVWESKITSDMVEGWSQDKIDELTDELDDAVEKIFGEMEDGAMIDNKDEKEEDEEEED